MSFDVPTLIEKDHKLIANPLIELLRLNYLIKFVYDDYVEYFIITKPQSQATDDRDLKHIECYSLPYEMDGQKIYDLVLTSYNLQQTMEYVLKALYGVSDALNALWTIDYVNPIFLNTYRSFIVSDKSLVEFILNDISDTFNCVPVFDTLTRKISFYSPDDFSTNKGLTFDYGKYLKTLEIEPETTEFCTILKPFGEDGLTISGVNPTGQNYLQDYSYYLYPYKEDESGSVIAHSYYMSDSLCGAILDYNVLLSNASGILDTTETGTGISIIFMTGHGLVAGDWILNRNRNNAYSSVATVIDANSFAISSSITSQVASDTIYKYKDGTYLKLIWDLEVLNSELTVLLNDLVNLNTTLLTYLDSIAVCEETGSTYGGHDVTYWRGLRDAKLNEISAKETDITNKETSITSKESDITALTTSLSIASNFTSAQQKELWQFQKVEKWEDANYINATDLYFGAIEKFASINSPQDVINIDIVNFLECIEEQINWSKLNIGDIANIKYAVFNTNSTARMIEFDFDFDNQNVSLTLANIYKVKNKKDKLLSELYQSIYTTKEYNKNKISWNELATNFNSNNDGIDVVPADITYPANPVEYTINTDSSANISIAWVFSGSGDAYNIDGFEIRVRKLTDSAIYVFGSTLAKEELYFVDYNQRKFELLGVPCDYYYTFGIRAYRKVRADINTNGILYSDNIVSPSSSTQPSVTVDYTGLLDGNSIQTVLSSIATAQETADGQVQGFFQITAPINGMSFGDIWIDTDGHAPPTTADIYRYEDATHGSQGTLAWRLTPTNAIGKIYLDAYNAQLDIIDIQQDISDAFSDLNLTKIEAQQLLYIITQVLNESEDFITKGTNLSITTELTNYQNALTALTDGLKYYIYPWEVV